MVRLTVNPDQTGDFRERYKFLDVQDGVIVKNSRKVSEDDTEVPGTEEAIRQVREFDDTVDNGTPQGDTKRLQTTSVYAQTDDDVFLTLSVLDSATDPVVDARAVLDSLRVEDG